MDLFNLVAKLSLDSSEYEAGLTNAQTRGQRLGSAVKTGMKVAAGAIAAGTAAVGAFAKEALKVGAGFDSAMSQVAATMGTTVGEIGELRTFAMEMGATTAFSATQAAEALNYMALAGYDAETSMRMLPNVLNLAAAGGMELATASDMVTDASSALGLSLDETETLIDQMARTSSKTNTSVAQLGEAILTVGGTAKGLSGDTEELNAVLGILADNGIKGSEAGTKLRNIMLALNPTTEDAAAAFEKLGIQAYDSNGELRSLDSIFGEMSAKLDGMTDQEKQEIISKIFNKADIAAVNALLDTNSERWDEVYSSIEDASGAAEAMANTQLDNLAGDVTLLKSAFEGVKIAVSDQLTPVIRDFVQFGSESFSRLGDAVRENGLAGALTELGDILYEKGHEIFESLLTGIREKLPDMIPIAMQAIMNFSGSLRENVGNIVDAGLTLIQSLADSLISNIPVFIETVPTIVSNIAGIINDNAPKLIASGITLIGKLITGIINSVPTLIAEFPKILRAVADVITAFNWIDLGQHIITTITTGIKNLASSIPDALKSIGTRGLNAVKNLNWRTLGIDIINFILNGIKSLVMAIPNALRDIGNSAMNGFRSMNWFSLGSNVVSGIVSGISSGVGYIADAARNAASSALSAAKSLLGISSPSKEFMWVGKMVDEGFAQGIDRYAGTVEDSINKLANATFDPFAEASGSEYESGDQSVGATTITINVYGEDKSVTEIAEEVERQLSRNMRSRGLVFA